MMTHPFAKIPLEKRKPVFLTALVASLALMVTLGVLGEPLKEKDENKPVKDLVAPGGIMSFEFAKTPDNAQKIIDYWGKAGVRQQAINHFFIDYLYLITYPISIGMTCVGVAFLLREKSLAFLAHLGGWLAWGQLIAGLCDAIENALLLTMLVQVSANASMTTSRILTIIKFALVIAGLLYVYIGAIILGAQKFIATRD
ncbi:MAG: hypothetical protein AB1757_25275 [Acidobacteriota bacterium]